MPSACTKLRLNLSLVQRCVGRPLRLIWVCIFSCLHADKPGKAWGLSLQQVRCRPRLHP